MLIKIPPPPHSFSVYGGDTVFFTIQVVILWLLYKKKLVKQSLPVKSKKD